MSATEELIKQELGISKLRRTGKGGGGCINEGSAYDTENGTIFVKFNNGAEAFEMFEGEHASLAALYASATVAVPKPMKVIKNPQGGAMLVMEYLDMHSLSKHSALLGEQMARLHLHNAELGKTQAAGEKSVHKRESDAEFVSKAISMVNAESRFVTEYDTSPLDAISSGMFLGPYHMLVSVTLGQDGADVWETSTYARAR
ncbi:ketosamine-3-kinase [Elysia marginata]|uniref:protein-ribulosamine 3-kinase n=1 Tax=Elysia marginata TaxID=1093978 RepID=A0AAV4JGI4_9GAST|nr:ketosamine-3-kinase [Elysia marginata]